MVSVRIIMKVNHNEELILIYELYLPGEVN